MVVLFLEPPTDAGRTMLRLGDHMWLATPILMASGLVFLLIECALGVRCRETPQVMGMLLDEVPEAIALGGLVASGSSVAP